MKRYALLALALALGAQAPASPARQLVGLGDSVTWGFGASVGRSYFARLKAELGCPSLNLSVCGSTSADLEERQLPRLPRFEGPGVVVVTTGGNDLIHNYGRTPPREGAAYGASPEQAGPWAARFAQRMDRILTALDKHFPAGCQVYLANIYDPTDGKGDIEHAPVTLPPWPHAEQVLGAYNQVLADLPKRHPNLHLVDIRQPFMGHGIHHGAAPYWYYVNLEDPNDDGYDAIYQAFRAAIR